MKEIHSVEDFKNDILSGKGVSLVDFKTSWCRHCKLMKPIVEEEEKKRGNQILFATVDIEQIPELPGTFEIVGTPTFIAFRDGKEIGRIIGYHQKNTFEEEVKKIFDES